MGNRKGKRGLHSSHFNRPSKDPVTSEMYEAIREYASLNGRNWRAKLKEEWGMGGLFIGFNPKNARVLKNNRAIIEPRLGRMVI